MDLLAYKLSTPPLLRTVVWPLCVTGCLAQPEQGPFFRRQIEVLEPLGHFVTVRKAIEIMESIWLKRGTTEPVGTVNSDMAG
jgi:hypothetical protein